MADLFIHGLSIANFRGITQTAQRLAPFQEINFLIGPNNAGKSTVLLFLAKYLHPKSGSSHSGWQRSFDALDVNLTAGSVQVRYEIAVPKATVIDRLESKFGSGQGARIRPILDGLFSDELVWLEADRHLLRLVEHDRPKTKSLLKNYEWQALWGLLTKQGSGDIDQHWVPESLSKIAAIAGLAYPEVKLIPAFRQIGDKGAEFSDYSGEGLIDKLAELQNPPHDERSKHAKFAAINGFLQAVTDCPDALVEVPYDRRHLLVHMSGKTLPLASLGTGIHEVVMLASFCTLLEQQIVCIEEPEIHLHPLLQKKFIRYLRDKTTNQYFIATHSASMVDAVDASIFSVRHTEKGTEIQLAGTPAARYEICQELGYQASDLLQANSIIWVEGPSDRIYLKHWLKALAPDLIEGLDFSIMFYGGRLLSHLNATDAEVDDFISLRRLNRNIAVVIDSDKTSAHAKINDTKRRIVEEFGARNVWVTAGKEIENYVPASLLTPAIQATHPNTFLSVVSTEKYKSRLQFEKKGKKPGVEIADKVAVARYVCESPAVFSELNLQNEIDRIISFVREANG